MTPTRAWGVAFVLVTLCIAYVPSRGQLGGPALRGDAYWYGVMVEAGGTVSERDVASITEVEEPFRYRIVVPLLARALPLSPAEALAAISWASLAASYALMLMIARHLGITARAAVLGLCCAVFSAPHLYNYHNPYLTDALGLLVLVSCLYALVSNNYLLFTLCCAFGIGVREALLFASPAWLQKRTWRRAAFAVLLSIAVYVGLHAFVGRPSKLGPPGVFPARPVRDMLLEAFGSWHVLWLIVPLGVSLAPRKRSEVTVMALLLLAGALLSSLFASDTMRMFHSLFPVVVLGTAHFLELSFKETRAWTTTFVAVCLTSSWVWHPVRFVSFEPLSQVHKLLERAALVVLFAVGLVPVLKVLLRWRSARTSELHIPHAIESQEGV